MTLPLPVPIVFLPLAFSLSWQANCPSLFPSGYISNFGKCSSNNRVSSLYCSSRDAGDSTPLDDSHIHRLTINTSPCPIPRQFEQHKHSAHPSSLQSSQELLPFEHISTIYRQAFENVRCVRFDSEVV